MKTITSIMYPAIAVFAFACFGLLPKLQAVSPPPDGGYAGGNTAEGQNALLSLTTGTYNTAVGVFALESNRTNIENTAIGAGALFVNIGDFNTATGAGALLSNTIGDSNTAIGAFALFSNTDGEQDTAVGLAALEENTHGSTNVAIGSFALRNNIIGGNNTAIGYSALILNTAGLNTAVGESALASDTSGASNTAIGDAAGVNQTTGSNNVYIGAGINGVAGESDACRIASIYGATITNGTEVFVNSDNRLGTITSSKRFKQNITPTRRASEALYELEPVTFQYKKEIDPEDRWQFGLVAEDVERINPDLVVHDKENKPYSVRYDQVNAMLLNEFLKEHRTVQNLRGTVAEQQRQITELTGALQAQMQKVNARLSAVEAAPRLVVSTP